MDYSGKDKIDFSNPLSKRFMDYWFSLPREGLIPRQSSLDIFAVPKLAPNLVIHEVISVERIIIRLAGTGIVARYGEELTGKNYQDLVAPERREKVYEAFRIMIDQPCGMLVTLKLQTKSGKKVTGESIGFPIMSTSNQAIYTLFQSNDVGTLGYDQPEAETLQIVSAAERVFIDIGAGIPEFSE